MTEINTNTTQAQVKTMNRGPLLSIQKLRVWFELKKWGFAHAGYVKAVDDVSFDLGYGDAIAIVGESGSGKTSLMKTILGINRPIKGEIVFGSKQIHFASIVNDLLLDSGLIGISLLFFIISCGDLSHQI